MIIIFDLDYTLLNTKKFKDRLAAIFNKENFYQDLTIYFKNKNINFNLETYLAILKKQGAIDRPRERELKLQLTELMRRLDNYLFPEVENILKHFEGGGVKLVLLTFGNIKFHRLKVDSLSVKRYFNKIVFEEKDKYENKYFVSLKKSPEKILIVNDNARETEAMVKIIGEKAKVFLIDGPYSRNIKHNWPIHKLAELIKYDINS